MNPERQQNQNLVNLRGQLERITYENEENGYLVGKARVYGHRDLVAIIGNIPSPTPGEILNMSGEWLTPPHVIYFRLIF